MNFEYREILKVELNGDLNIKHKEFNEWREAQPGLYCIDQFQNETTKATIVFHCQVRILKTADIFTIYDLCNYMYYYQLLPF